MYNHIKQFYFRLAFSAAVQAIFAVFYDWNMATWLGAILIALMIVYLLDMCVIYLSDIP